MLGEFSRHEAWVLSADRSPGLEINPQTGTSEFSALCCGAKISPGNRSCLFPGQRQGLCLFLGSYLARQVSAGREGPVSLALLPSPARLLDLSSILSLSPGNFLFTNHSIGRLLPWPLNTVLSSLRCKKRSPLILPACRLPGQARASQPHAECSDMCSDRRERAQARPGPLALRYCVARRYTSEDSFLLASGFRVLVPWNSSVSLFCNRWL